MVWCDEEGEDAVEVGECRKLLQRKEWTLSKGEREK